MTLEYQGAYHCHCSISLRCGTTITLKSLSQKMTYGGLLEGTPKPMDNDRLLQGTIARARGQSDMTPFLIQPTRRDFRRVPGDMAKLPERYRISEWMPMITCVGTFESSPVRDKRMDSSWLKIIWLQDEYALPISAGALESIKSIDWASHALDSNF